MSRSGQATGTSNTVFCGLNAVVFSLNSHIMFCKHSGSTYCLHRTYITKDTGARGGHGRRGVRRGSHRRPSPGSRSGPGSCPAAERRWHPQRRPCHLPALPWLGVGSAGCCRVWALAPPTEPCAFPGAPCGILREGRPSRLRPLGPGGFAPTGFGLLWSPYPCLSPRGPGSGWRYLWPQRRARGCRERPCRRPGHG